MYHNVLSSGTNNVAVALLFSRFDGYKKRGLDFSNCDNVTKDSRPLSDFIVDWMYPGKGDLSMGNTDLEVLRERMLENVNRKGLYTLKQLTSDVGEIYEEKDSSFIKKYAKKAYLELAGGKVPITVDMIKGFSKEKLRIAAMCFERVHPANAPWLEYHAINPSKIECVLLKYLKKHKNKLHRNVFLELYVDGLEGSPKFGNQFFDILAGKGNDEVTESDAKMHLQMALKKYYQHQTEGEEAAEPDVYRNAKKPENYDEGDVDQLYKEEKLRRVKRYLEDDVGEDANEHETGENDIENNEREDRDPEVVMGNIDEPFPNLEHDEL